MIGPVAEARQKLTMALYARGWTPVARRVEAAARKERFVDWVSGACLLVRRPDAEAAGLLDERFFLYTEDVDFCASLRARGRRILFTPAAEVVHLRGRSRVRDAPLRMVEMRIRFTPANDEQTAPAELRTPATPLAACPTGL